MIDEDCDIAAVVEVMQRRGGHSGYDDLRAALGDGWTGAVTAEPRPNTGVGHAEYYAVFWRPAVAQLCDGWDGLRYVTDHDGSPGGTGADRFAREPAYTCLEHRGLHGAGFDFLLGAFHATWSDGDTSKIRQEASCLHDVVEEMRLSRDGEKDIVLAGDFNLMPRALAESTSLADWTEGEGSTLNLHGERTANLYDHFLVAEPLATAELRGKARVLDVRSVSPSRELFRRTVSDHLPIALVFEANAADDD